MFHKALRLNIEYLENRVRDLETQLLEDRFAQAGKFDRLLDALGLVEQVTHKTEYVKKGGPERG